MKKFSIFVISLLLCFCSVFMLTGCGGDECCGEWKISYIQIGDQTCQIGDDFMDISLTAESIKVKLDADGQAYMKIVSTYNSDKYRETIYSWQRNGEIITFWSNEETLSMEGYYTKELLRIDILDQEPTTSAYFVRA